MVLSDRTGVKGARVDGATASVSGKELGKGGVKVIGDEGGDDILITVRNNNEVTRTNGIEIVFPSWAWEYTRLRAGGTWSTSLCISIHHLGHQFVSFSLLVEDYSHR